MIKTQVTNSTTNTQDILKFKCPEIQNRIIDPTGTKHRSWFTIGTSA